MAKDTQIYHDSTLRQNVNCVAWNSTKMEDTNSFSDDSVGENSDNSVTSISSSSHDLEEDASSSSSKPSSSSSYGPLFQLSDLMTQLPIKRGLSKYYHGKSQSFTSLGSVGNLEELAKKESSYSQRMKSCRSYGWGLNGRKFGPKATITKKSSTIKGSLFSSKGGSTTSLGTCRSSMSINSNNICSN
ncbi:hypothetical protein Leryth_012853 [Lithospermum erythrorhizon]|uniref:Oxidative stress 3 n=1 Tax=Lithospermum erythrorhizon TaxID=34254 RepID=A0AAV3P7U4_LITER|nr:hypothetical protein Leryth_012853 [Lithospermum erythrorhizon]